MSIHLIAVGTNMPAWVKAGYDEYAKRFPKQFSVKLTELAMAKRQKGTNTDTLKKKEAKQIQSALDKNAHLVILDERGKSHTSLALAQQMAQWQSLAKPINLIIGGPDGFDASIKTEADEMWSLSPLTLPHPVVRIVLIEQLYRAWTILQGHPYHRA